MDRAHARGASLSDAESARIRVAIAGSVRLYRDGLAHGLGRHAGLSVVLATDYESLVERATEVDADILLLDVSAPGTPVLLDALRSAVPRTQIIAFAIGDSDDTVLEFVEAGVVAFIPRDCALSELVATIERVACGEALWSPRRMGMLCRRLAELASAARAPRSPASLTGREQEIATCIDLGMSNKQIAAKLGIEVSTVKNHVHKLLEKLHVTRRGEAAAFVRQRTALPARFAARGGRSS